MTDPDKSAIATPAAPHATSDLAGVGTKIQKEDSFEVFKKEEGAVDFRTVEWIHASVIFLKGQSLEQPMSAAFNIVDPGCPRVAIFATGVLSIPSSLYALGAFPGAVNVIGWQFLNTYCAIVQGDFRSRHPRCHSIADMADVVGGPWLREVVGFLFLLAWTIASASGIFGSSVALNALSDHAICTNYFMLVATVAIFILASVRKFQQIAWLTWVGFLSIFIAVFIVV